MQANNALKLLMSDTDWYHSSRLNIAGLVGNLAYHAMMLEVHLTPKPGLVDCANNGAHSDMTLDTFIDSAVTLRPFMKRFTALGMECDDSTSLLRALRPAGIEAEQAMFEATFGVNTHKGMIFSMGLICGAAGWLASKGKAFRAEAIRDVIKSACQGLTEELKTPNPVTVGEWLYRGHGLTGIRGEAEQGYPCVYQYSLPVYQQAVDAGQSEQQALLAALVSLMAHNQDTNVINRGGLMGLDFVRHRARQLQSIAGGELDLLEKHLCVMDTELTEMNISPGGSADLLAVTWMLAQLDELSSKGS